MEALDISCNVAEPFAQDRTSARTRKSSARTFQTTSELVDRALGPAGLAVLTQLLDLRALDDEVRITRAGPRRLGLSDYDVRVALARLEAAGLQKYVGRFVRRVNVRHPREFAWWTRTVSAHLKTGWSRCRRARSWGHG